MPGNPTFAEIVEGTWPAALSALWGAKPPAWNDPDILWAALPLIAALLIGAGIIFFVDRWRKRVTTQSPGSPNEDQLDHYRTLFEQGVLSQEEYNRLKALLGERMRKELNLPEPPNPQAPAKPPDAMPPPPGVQPG